MLSRLPVVVVLLAALVATGCFREEPATDYGRQLAPGEVALREVPTANWPRFTLGMSNRAGLETAISNSLAWLSLESSKAKFPRAGVSHAEVKASLERFREILAGNPDERTLNRLLQQEFRLLASVGWDGRGSVLFTGYYTPIFDASLQPDEHFRYPIYRRPDDLISPRDPKAVARQRLSDGSTRPYPVRADLMASGALNGLELAWLAEPFDPYIINVQGSAKLRLPDNTQIEVGYDGTNGHPYVSVGRKMVADGALTPEQLSLPAMRAYFRANPDHIQRYVGQNPRLVFFTETEGGPFGSLGPRVPVVGDVSIATDKAIFPPGALTFVVTRTFQRGRIQPYAGFRVDQDTGGAIRAPGKCDLYMGVGVGPGDRAGRQLEQGFLYYLLLK